MKSYRYWLYDPAGTLHYEIGDSEWLAILAATGEIVRKFSALIGVPSRRTVGGQQRAETITVAGASSSHQARTGYAGHSRSLCTFLCRFCRPFPLQAFLCPLLRCRL